MNIAAMTELEFYDALTAIGRDTDFSLEISVMRPHSIAKRRTNVDNAVQKHAEEIGDRILKAGDSKSSAANAFASGYFVDFVGRLLNELYLPIHNLLCSKKFFNKTVETTIAGAQIAALTQLFVDYLNISTVTALGIASAITLAVIRATQGTFCKLSKEQILPLIERLKA